MFFIKTSFLTAKSRSEDLFNEIMVGLRIEQHFLRTWNTQTRRSGAWLGFCWQLSAPPWRLSCLSLWGPRKDGLCPKLDLDMKKTSNRKLMGRSQSNNSLTHSCLHTHTEPELQ